MLKAFYFKTYLVKVFLNNLLNDNIRGTVFLILIGFPNEIPLTVDFTVFSGMSFFSFSFYILAVNMNKNKCNFNAFYNVFSNF